MAFQETNVEKELRRQAIIAHNRKQARQGIALRGEREEAQRQSFTSASDILPPQQGQASAAPSPKGAKISAAAGGLSQLMGQSQGGTTSESQGAVQGGLSGAATGAAIGGPYGAVIGGGLGAVTGILGAKSAKKKALAGIKAQQLQQEGQIEGQTSSRINQAFANMAAQIGASLR